MNTITIADLGRLLKRALTCESNEAIRRLPEGQRTVEGVAGAYLPCDLRTYHTRSEAWNTGWAVRNSSTFDHGYHLHLTDPGTTHTLLVALALALGLDPGEGALGMAWYRMPTGAWCLSTGGRPMYFCGRSACWPDLPAPAVAAEPHPISALVLAVKHVVGSP